MLRRWNKLVSCSYKYICLSCCILKTFIFIVFFEEIFKLVKLLLWIGIAIFLGQIVEIWMACFNHIYGHIHGAEVVIAVAVAVVVVVEQTCKRCQNFLERYIQAK